MTRNPAVGNTPLRLSVLSGVSALVESVPLKQVVDADAKMMAGKARFRMVLTINNSVGDPAKTYLNTIRCLDGRASPKCIWCSKRGVLSTLRRECDQVSTCRQARDVDRDFANGKKFFNDPPDTTSRAFSNHFVSQADSWHADCIPAMAGEAPITMRGRNQHHSAPTRPS
jgi:hypothetical protein